jgi:hypothetical protein
MEGSGMASRPAVRLLIILLCIFCKVGNAGQQPGGKPRVLRAGSSETIQGADFNYYGDAKCDAAGNMFFDMDLAGSILEISSDGSRRMTYSPWRAEDPSVRVDFVDFALPPSGGLRALLQSEKETWVVDFDSDGSVKHKTRLDVPEHVEARKLAVFDDGVVLFAGFFTRLATENRPGKSFVAFFESSGKLRQQLADFPDVKLAELSGRRKDGAVTIGQDGHAYVLSADKVSVVSETGQVIRRLRFHKIDPQESAARLDVSEGLLAVTLVKVATNYQIHATHLVIDASSGARLGLYEAADELGGTAVCFSPSKGFTYLKEENGQLKLISAPLQ